MEFCKGCCTQLCSYFHGRAGMVKSFTASSICRTNSLLSGWGANSILGNSLIFLQLSGPHYHPSPPPHSCHRQFSFQAFRLEGGGEGGGGIKVLDEGLE